MSRSAVAISFLALLPLLVAGCAAGASDAPPAAAAPTFDPAALSSRTLLEGSVHAVDFRDSLVAVAVDDSVLVLDPADGSVRFRAGGVSAATAIDVAPGPGLLAAMERTTLRVWDLDSPGAPPERLSYTTATGHSTSSRGGQSGDLAPGGEWAATTAAVFEGVARAALWDVAGGSIVAELAEYTGPEAPGGPQGQGVAFAPGGDRIAVALMPEGVVRIYGVPDGALLEEFELPPLTAVVNDLAWSPDGTRLAVVSTGYEEDRLWFSQPVRIRDLSEDRWLVELEAGEFPSYAAFAPGADHLLTGTQQESTIKVWELPTGRLVRTLPAGGEWVTGLAVEGDAFVSGTRREGGALKIWSATGAR